jgi:hypothetical protein
MSLETSNKSAAMKTRITDDPEQLEEIRKGQVHRTCYCMALALCRTNDLARASEITLERIRTRPPVLGKTGDAGE